jgi:DNA-binding beta-propeller fold protein YncE
MTGWLRRRPVAAIALAAVLLLACVGVAMAVTGGHSNGDRADPPRTTASGRAQTVHRAHVHRTHTALNVYSHTLPGMLTDVSRRARYLIYAPDSGGSGVYVIDPKTYRVIRYIATGEMVQHVVPAWNLRTLYATNDLGNSLTPINPDTGKRAGPNIPVADPYNMYFTPDGRHAIVVEEAQQTLAFRNPRTFALQKALPVHCGGVDHMDFTADGRYALASCEFSSGRQALP